MDWNHVYAISGTIAAIGIGVGGLMMWYLSKLDGDIKNITNSVNALNSSMNGWVQHLTAMQAEQSKRFDQFMFEWNKESKDFHGRLCKIEENRNK